MPSKKVAWIEGEVTADVLINKLADEIANAKIPDTTNRWEKVFEVNEDKWVTYTKTSVANTQGTYKHTDGKTYQVYKLPDLRDLKAVSAGTPLVDKDGYIYETNGYGNTKTGKKIQVNEFVYTDEEGNEITLSVPGLLVVNVNEDDPTNTVGKKCYVLQQGKYELDGVTFTPGLEWNEYRLITQLPSDWNDLIEKKQWTVYYYGSASSYWTYVNASPYTFGMVKYTANPVHFYDRTVVLKTVPDVPTGEASNVYYVMLKHPTGQYNYVDVYYGKEFTGKNPSGSSADTYSRACDIRTVIHGKVPVILNQKEAELQYRKWNNPDEENKYNPPQEAWALDYDEKVEIKSPPSHFFYGADSVVSWVPNKKRRPDYWVEYNISVSNDRVAIVIVGDPSPDMDAYYNSFAYIGKTIPFADYDQKGNFGITVGMGDLTKEKSGFLPSDIKQDSNQTYSGWGRYTSNGMYSFSMLQTRSSVYFQAYYPAFITQLPNYSGVGTIPPELSKMVLEKNGFQMSKWTKRYHASPIYLVHQFEGYRGYLDSVVAIEDHNLINKDELVVDTEEPKDPQNPEAGNWTEVYKFFKTNTPVNFFKYSPNPTDSTIAILKEVY
ncbi:hypothetical protein [Brevibacillus reuszeri]|uniref:hypothetical protein n=1 Tax=Brevibacillus reuszeri TaxID=54915 RepID=UPI00289A15B7|nr:hypothetical protein [Brevibacillus reuszeri]